MTTNLQIKDALRNQPYFKGVYLYDQIDQIPTLHNQSIIINYVTTQEAQEGKVGHFVVLSNTKQPKGRHNNFGLYFFDPYGLPPDEPRNILQLPNTGNISKLIQRIGGGVEVNREDFQAWMKGDDLCGVYSTEFVINPNFNTNPLFKAGQNRIKLDKKLIEIYGKLGFAK